MDKENIEPNYPVRHGLSDARRAIAKAMANENETVEQVLSRAENGDWNCSRCGDQCDCPNTENIIKTLASDFLAAHKREIADFQRRYDECVRKFNEADLERVRLRDALKPITNLLINDNCSRSCVGNGMCNQCDFYDSCEGEYVFSVVREVKEKAREVLNG